MTSGCFDSLLKLHFTLTATQLVCHLLLLFPARCEIIQFEKITFPQIKHISSTFQQIENISIVFMTYVTLICENKYRQKYSLFMQNKCLYEILSFKPCSDERQNGFKLFKTKTK